MDGWMERRSEGNRRSGWGERRAENRGKAYMLSEWCNEDVDRYALPCRCQRRIWAFMGYIDLEARGVAQYRGCEEMHTAFSSGYEQPFEVPGQQVAPGKRITGDGGPISAFEQERFFHLVRKGAVR